MDNVNSKGGSLTDISFALTVRVFQQIIIQFLDFLRQSNTHNSAAGNLYSVDITIFMKVNVRV